MSSSHSQAHSGISSYSPISTLEQQYAEPVGQRLLLFLKANANCCLAGGVETYLKLQKGNKSLGSSSSNEAYLDRASSTVSSTNTTESTQGGTDDPFGFLNQEPVPENNTSEKKKKGIGSFLKKVAKSSVDNLERGIHGLAMNIDGGKNPDILMVGLYDSSELLSLTEARPLPTEDRDRLQGCVFRIPLVVPATTPNQTSLELRLYIQSGAAAILGKKAAKHYLLASVPIRMADLQQHLAVVEQPGASPPPRPATKPPPKKPFAILTLPLTSSVVVDGHLQVLLQPDAKFPPFCGRGWSLADPDTRSYTYNGLYHYPLDQSYQKYGTNHSLLVATERATESTIVLPLATAWARLCHDAGRQSLQHATAVSQQLLHNRHDAPFNQTKATVQLEVGYLCTPNTDIASGRASISIQWQRPDSLFDVELLQPTQVRVPVHTDHIAFQPVVPTTFYPPLVPLDKVLPALLQQQQAQANATPYMLGQVVLQLHLMSAHSSGKNIGGDPFASIGSGSQTVNSTGEVTVCLAALPLELYLKKNENAGKPISVPVIHSITKESMGHVVLRLQVTLPETQQPQANPAPLQGGLVSLVGLDTLTEDLGTGPVLDYAPRAASQDPATVLRLQQLKTMGNFISHAYLQQHIQGQRSGDIHQIEDRYGKYRTALSYNPNEPLPSHEDKSPKPFRPSSSRTEVLLAGLPFNVHTHTLSVEPIAQRHQTPGEVFGNITCGAPADHARGFGNIVSSQNGTHGANVSAVGPISGGLRRLEAKRAELSKALVEAQSNLIQAVANYFVQARQSNQVVHHIPAIHNLTAGLRWKVFETTQALHHVTWACTVRRASVFSQALGIAMTSYLAALSDAAKLASGWPDLWARHGFLIAYEGLLSAAGKELGMIEDASVGIAMLRMVSVVLVQDDGGGAAQNPERVAVPNSPYLRWVHLQPSGVGSQTQYVLQVGVDTNYYMQRIPEPLKNGRPVRFYPLLFEVGVDIRQWGAHTHKNAKNQLSNNEQEVVAGGLIDDEDDDAGPEDHDVLVALNKEALRKLNAYANLISPSGGVNGQANGANPQVHPSLSELHEHIMASANKMNYSILDEAATACLSMGGGCAVFCKSGKDRTAMHVTYKSSQFVHRFLQKTGAGPPIVSPSNVYEDASLMRTYGTRLPICEKNVGQAMYAFNALQVKFMPDALKPPPGTLAGFLKGGKVFQRGGGIES